MSATNPTQETKSTNAGSAAEPKSNGGTAVQPTQRGALPGVIHEPIRVIRDDGSLDPAWDPKLSDAQMVALYEQMVRTRIIDERLVTLQRQGRIGFHIGSLGEEATILGSAAACRPQDWIWPCYREFGALLMRGMPLQAYVDNMFGNANDPVKGRQMPDHYSGKPYKFGSVSSPIGTQITQAVGFGWAAKMRKDDLVTLVYFGEGATSSNEFHNGANFAGVFKTPTVFLCRNNGWAISVPAHKQSGSQTFADKAVAYGIHGVRCDGNDLLAVYAATRQAVERAARGEGATLVESLTYRLSGHSTSDDPKAYRKDTEVDAWKSKDPNVRFRAFLDKRGLYDDKRQTTLEEQTAAELADCVKAAEAAPLPSLESMFDDVYAELPWHLREQRAELLAGPRAKGHGH
ncbi:MAG: thiamine pyrophosphate-dependent dehydrogenase E1 component subunit alpha [Myxococcales bacterium]|nr:thiamine pyrophosphate-dependent dehydrogenase E1 component subunit alpha [Myxococcales bacterium]